MYIFCVTFATVVALYSTEASTKDDSSVYCAFNDDTWMSRRQELSFEAQNQHSGGMLSPDNVANKISSKSEYYQDPVSGGEILKDNKTIRCPASQDFCYSLWESDPNDKNKITIIKQGCWDQSVKACSQSTCVPRGRVHQRHNNTHFCCCIGDFCNVNISTDYVLELEPTMKPIRIKNADPNYRYRTIIIALVSVSTVAITIALSYLVYRLTLGSRQQPYEPEQLIESPPTPTFDLDQLKLCNRISTGRYGDVYRGTLYDYEVAVKLFDPMQKQYFINERDIYTLPHMDHPSIIKFYGSDEHMNVDGIVPYSIIVMSLIPQGTLSQYLKEHVFDWNQMLKFARSASSGLAHLHTDIMGGAEKPSIAHRDFNSRNILIKDDLTCCICDFGFAMKILGSKFIRNGMEEVAEQSPISDVGTLRYMAPEVLDGAVNLRDCEASLKQIDVYSLGLVLWEIASRCSDLYQGMPVPEYKLPFETELGSHPSFEDMQRHVSWKRGRPIFPDVWKDTNPAIRSLKETIEDSWDQDAEARLTSLCVEERLLELCTLWEGRNKVGTTPTNPGSSAPDQIVRNQTDQSQGNTNTLSDGPVCNFPSRNSHRPTMNIMDLPQEPQIPREDISEEGSTVETVLTASPSDPLPPNIGPTSTKASNLLYAQNNQPLQPHQGINPTVERNTHKRSDDKLVILGNNLVDKSAIEEGQVQGDRVLPGGTNNVNFSEEMYDAIADNLESSLVQNDLLGHQRQPSNQDSSVNPPQSHTLHNIGYAHGHNLHSNPAEPLIPFPKQPNVPGNGSAYPHPPSSSKKPQNLQKPKKFKLKRPKAEKISGKMSDLYNFGKNLLRGGNHDSSSDDSSSYPTENLRNPAQITPRPVSNYQEQPEIDPGKSNLEPRHVSTEVCLMNGAPVVRPMSLHPGGKELLNYNIDQAYSDSANESDQETLPKCLDTGSAEPGPNRPLEPHLGIAEVGVAELRNPSPLCRDQTSLKQVRLRSQSSIDLSPTGTSLVDVSEEDSKIKRPSSLHINGHNYTKIPPRSVPCLNNLGRDNNYRSNRLSGIDCAASNINGSAERLKHPNRDTSESLLKARQLANGDHRHNSEDVVRPLTEEQNPARQSTITMTQFPGRESEQNCHEPADYPC